MSYTIFFDKWTDFDKYDNLTLETLCKNDYALSKTEVFENWYMYNYGEDDYLEDVREGYARYDYLNLKDLAKEFKESDAYFILQDDLTPAYNEAYILKNIPTEQQILITYDCVPDISVVYIKNLDTYALALTGYGMNLSDCIELAYYIIDGQSPIEAKQIMSLDENAKKLLLFCREKKQISFNEIKKFIKEKC